jgi:peptidoglycan-associated lipoprotein
MRNKLWFVALALIVALSATGCATKKYVRQETGAVGTRVDEVTGKVEEAQTRLDTHERQIGETSKTAQEALKRAMEAGKLAEGKLLYETVLTDEKVKFGFDTSDLSPEAKAAIDEFAAQLKAENQGVYIEIQGHTDSVGSEKYNEELGLLRAESVRRYLSQQHQFPLHRINVISYGETAAVADNSTREGRSQNRRVALVVLK